MKVVTFGEIMLRLAPKGYLRFLQSAEFEATYGGGEANVAVSLAQFGDEASFVTKLPNNDIGEGAISSLRAFGVDVSKIVRGGDRVGIYFLEKGASVRPSKVVYDRAGSSIATASKSDFDWEAIFDEAEWFHFTGITPALNDEIAKITLEAVKEAKKRNIKVSCDLNYRKKLWSREKAKQTMTEIMPYVDVCICNEEDAQDVFGISASGTDIEGGKINHDGYVDVAKQLTEQFSFSAVAITLRESISASDNDWSAMLYTDGEAYFSKKYHLHIVDRVGGGDSFGAGLIHALGKGYDSQMAIEYAVGASALKHTIEGDFNRVSESEVLSLIKNGGSGRVQR